MYKILLFLLLSINCLGQNNLYTNLATRQSLTAQELRVNTIIPKNSTALDIKTYSLDSIGNGKLQWHKREILNNHDTAIISMSIEQDTIDYYARIYWEGNKKTEVLKLAPGSWQDIVITKTTVNERGEDLIEDRYGVKKNKMKSVLHVEREYYETGKVKSIEFCDPSKESPKNLYSIERYLYFPLDSIGWQHKNYSSFGVTYGDSSSQVCGWREKSVKIGLTAIDSTIPEVDNKVLHITKVEYNSLGKKVMESSRINLTPEEVGEGSSYQFYTKRYFYSDQNRLILIEVYDNWDRMIEREVYTYFKVDKYDQGLISLF
ncbi:MAG: hypothetical protein ACKOXB_00905 [Flavobacteriales bacterium]